MRVALFKELVRIEQTLFGLPFLLSSILLALNGAPPKSGASLVWVVAAFFFARSAGMAFNQLVDAQIDARNPRTSHRPLPSRRVTKREVWVVACAALAGFFVTVSMITVQLLGWALLAAACLVIYPYLKRYTVGCHLMLGFIHFLSPLLVSLALTGGISDVLLLVGVAAGLLVLGTDILYATQDYAFDNAEALYSLPARIGIPQSLLLARSLHVLMLVVLVFVGWVAYLPIFYYGVVGVVGMHLYRLYQRLGKEKIEKLCFSCNRAVAVTLLFFVALSVLWDSL